MPRSLPWLAHSVASAPPKRKRIKLSPPSSHSLDGDGNEAEDDLDRPLPTIRAVPGPSSRKQDTVNPRRSPSTSPPPAAPAEEYMRPGLRQDDGWIMVEDEFLSIARTFTAHLHWREYVRLKEEAKSRRTRHREDGKEGRDTRFEEGQSSVAARKRAVVLKQRVLQKNEEQEDEDEEDEDAWDPMLNALLRNRRDAGSDFPVRLDVLSTARLLPRKERLPPRVKQSKKMEVNVQGERAEKKEGLLDGLAESMDRSKKRYTSSEDEDNLDRVGQMNEWHEQKQESKDLPLRESPATTTVTTTATTATTKHSSQSQKVAERFKSASHISKSFWTLSDDEKSDSHDYEEDKKVKLKKEDEAKQNSKQPAVVVKSKTPLPDSGTKNRKPPAKASVTIPTFMF